MKLPLRLVSLLLAFVLPAAAYGLSRRIERDIEFPKDYDPIKADSIRKVIRDERFQFVDGHVSYWPPDWSTRLSYEGSAASLNQFIAELRRICGISLRLAIYHGRNDELRRDTSWQIDFSHARPHQLTLFLNVASTNIDCSKIVFPEWPAP